MAIVISKVGFTFRDARGDTGRVGWYYRYTDTSTPGGDALLTAQALGPLVHACSNAALIGGFGLGSEVLSPDQYGAPASEYQTVADKARIIMLATDLTQHSFEIPAPKSSQFQADQETVNPAATEMSALLAALIAVDASGGFVSTKAGASYIGFVAGMRVRRPASRKRTIWSLTPSLGGPDE